MNRKAKTLLVLALVAVVGMAFRVSWNALRDVAGAIGADNSAALLYPFVVDGLMALALVAALVLTGPDRTFALRVLAAYTVASLVLNYVHGLVPTLHAHAHERMHLAAYAPANWALVLLATSLPVGSIFFGSDLVAKVLHHRTPAPATATAPQTALDAVSGESPAHPATAPASRPVVEAPTLPLPATAAPARAPHTASTKPRARQTPGAGKSARPVRTDAELLDALRDLRTGAPGPVSQRTALAALGIGVPRLRALLAEHGLTLDPLPAHAPLHLVDTDQDSAAVAL